MKKIFEKIVDCQRFACWYASKNPDVIVSI